MLNVKDYGILGNGEKDYTIDIQRLIDKNGGGNTIYFPAGKYIVSKTLVLNANTTLIGDGSNTKIMCASNADAFNDAMITNRFDNKDYTPNITIRNLQIWGYKENNKLKYKIDGIRLISTYHAVIENVKVAWFGNDGISVYGSTRIDGTIVYHNTNYIKDCFVHENGECGIFGNNQGHDFHIIGGDIGANNSANIHLKCSSSSISNVRAIWGSKTSAGVIIGNINTQVTNCNIDGNATHSIWVFDTDNAYIMGNKLYAASEKSGGSEYGYSSIYVSSKSNNTSIISNQIMGTLYEPNYLSYCIYNDGIGTQILSNSMKGNNGKKEDIYSSKEYILSISKEEKATQLS